MTWSNSQLARHRPVKIVFLQWIAILLLVGCRESATPARDAKSLLDPLSDPMRVGNAAVLEEFTAIADRIENSENPYLGRTQIARLQNELRASGAVTQASSVEDIEVRSERYINLQLQLCWHHLRLGDIDAASNAIERAFEEVHGAGVDPTVAMYRLKALVYLREGEVRNCVQNHNRDCCVFPLQGGGVHADKAPMNRAKENLLAVLAKSPTDLEAGWLLNIAGMALGDYPSNIPEPFRMFPKVQRKVDVPRLVDVAGKLGVDTFNLCGGAMVEDFDGDGLLDIVTSTYDPRGALTYYRNAGSGTFEDRSFEAGTSSQLGGLNCIAADYDNDSDLDVLVLRGAWLKDDGQIRNSLLRNNGGGVFEDVTELAGLAEPARPTQAAAWGDYDNDGDLDLYVGNESRVELEDSGGNYPSQLFRNNGNGTFTDVAAAAGVTNDRYCKGVAAGDFDNDGDLDIYVSNQGWNRLYRNDGRMHFTDIARSAEVAEPRQQSFACWFFDYDNNGWLDLFVAAYQSTNDDVVADYLGIPHSGVSPCLYRNRGDGVFENVTQAMGLAHAYLPMGANFGDIDNDGFLDVYLTTGRPDFATLTPNVMLWNRHGTGFSDVTTASGLGHLQKGHGVAFADIDNDGDQDIYHQLGGFYPGDKFRNALFLNPLRRADDAKHRFVAVRLRGKGGNSQAIGARVRVVARVADGIVEFHRSVGAVSSFGGSPFRQEIGLGDAIAVQEIEVTWPWVQGKEQHVQRIVDVPLDSFIEVTEGLGGYRLLELPQLSMPASLP